jgi:HAD superfamily hydrolase (TIGR01458 family)
MSREWDGDRDPIDGEGEAPDADILPTPQAEARARLAGVRGLLLDLDGVILLRGEAVPGAVDAMARLTAQGIPYRILTNTSLVSRATLAGRLARTGIEVPPAWIVSALSATAGYARDEFAGSPIYLLASPDARREFAGQWLLSHAEADAGATAAAVVIGDSPEELTYANIDRAFRFVHGGARLVAMHRNRWWLTPAGPTIDAGAYVVGLEYAAGVTATVVGKPTREFFVRSLDDLGVGPYADLLMVGDDLDLDSASAMGLGLRAAHVLTGRHGIEDARAAARGDPPARGGPIEPTVVLPSLADVVDALEPPPD